MRRRTFCFFSLFPNKYIICHVAIFYMSWRCFYLFVLILLIKVCRSYFLYCFVLS